METQPTFGEAGETVRMLGTDFSGATSVAFNGIAAEFTILSPTQITATIPAGAGSGKVEVVTPNGTLLSNAPFRVEQ